MIALAFTAPTAPAQPGPPDSLWMKTFGEGGDDNGRGICAAHDNGFIITGTTTSYGAGLYDVFVAKVDENGDSIWFKNFGGPYVDSGYSVIKTNDGGYIVAGKFQHYTGNQPDIYLLKINETGDTMWTKIIGGAGLDIAYDICQTFDGGYIITGNMEAVPGNNTDLFLLKIDSLGNEQWSRTFGGSTPDRGDCVKQTPDGGYIVVGDVNYEYYLLKTDSLGNEEWSRIIVDAASSSIDLTYDGGFIVCGGYHGPPIFLKKYNSQGDEIWTYYHTGMHGGRYVRETEDYGFVTCGSTDTPVNDRQMYLFKTDSTGQFEWELNFGGPYYDSARELAIDNERNFGLVGVHEDPVLRNGYIALLYVGWETGVKYRYSTIPVNYHNFKVFPNPFNNSFIIEFPVSITNDTNIHFYDVTGRTITPNIVTFNNHAFMVNYNNSHFSTGIYFFEIHNGDEIYSGKVNYIK